MTVNPVLAATNWKTNAELIKDIARLRYLKKSDLVLDPTWGKGIWWNAWSPRRLVRHDITLDGTDFRNLSMYGDCHFDAIAFDPPYVSVGGRETTGISEYYKRYGMKEAPRSPAGVQALINDGLTEMHRLVKPKGIVLIKVQDYISSGKLWLGTYWTMQHALLIGFEVVDRLEHFGTSRPQPCRWKVDKETGARLPVKQQHARRNLSTMLVLRKTKMLRSPEDSATVRDET